MLELALIALQFITVRFVNPQGNFSFTTTYMEQTGVYIFLVIGFFAFAILCTYVMRNTHHQLFYKMITLFAAGGIVELIFYMSIEAAYQGVYLYSIFGKLIAVGLGAIIYEISLTKKVAKTLKH